MDSQYLNLCYRLTLRPLFYILCVLVSVCSCSGGSSSDSTTGAVDAENCPAVSEICGDGIDQDCDGSDLLCEGSDKDQDGYTSNDCNDNDRFVYPTISLPCTGDFGSGYQTCLSSGQFSECRADPLCEAVPPGKCYYISTGVGKDSNPGSFEFPWKSFKNLQQASKSMQPFYGLTTLGPGDVVYLDSGRYHPEDNHLFLDFISGEAQAPIIIKAYPGAKAIISPRSRSESIPKFGINISRSSYITISGLEIEEARDQGIFIAESDHIIVNNCNIHNTWGDARDNLAGIYAVRSTNIRIHHNTIYDNYDTRRQWATGNGTILFEGGNIRVDHNTYHFSSAIPSSYEPNGILYKHAANLPGQRFEADHNVITDYKGVSIGTGSGNSYVHHNLIVRSAPFQSANFGGPTNNSETYFEYNTIINGAALDYTPTDEYTPIGNLYFRNNVVVDNQSYDLERGIVRICEYCDDHLFNILEQRNVLKFSSNCYYNTSYDLSFRYFAGNPQPNGAVYSFVAWQGLTHDSSSYHTNPQLNSSYGPTNPLCSNKGWLAQ